MTGTRFPHTHAIRFSDALAVRCQQVRHGLQSLTGSLQLGAELRKLYSQGGDPLIVERWRLVALLVYLGITHGNGRIVCQAAQPLQVCLAKAAHAGVPPGE